ncbi:hypothetical protein TIFTF001_044408 [Ficus carica]|uniref:Uncharacterized protein n=1 Tax=Ficus carica TaxID=3494 RepID=A0AA87Z868_FICCA|nr:hypothetical protein TIFTF001_044404 [Ficus carica]GMN30070.1 hypothetical protein TIFTF001_044408 [Ficus carica]
MPDRTWAHFRTLVIAHFGPVPDEGADEPYRDPEIYRAMNLERFQEAMLPHIPQDIVSPGMQALLILRNGLPPQIRQYVPAPMPDMTVGHMIDDIMEAEIIAHAMQAGPVFPEDAIPAVPLQEVLAPEADVEVEADDQDAADDIVAPEDQPEDPPVIDFSSDDEEDREEHEPGYGGWLDEADEFEDDLEEILFDDGDWDVDSDTSSVVTIESID